jgi:DNA-binding NarL/FixJ family response regulator
MATSAGRKIGVMIVADHPIMLDGLRLAIQRESDMNVTCEACTEGRAVDEFNLHHPDVTLIDLQFPCGAGIRLMQLLHKISPKSPLVVLVTYASERQKVRAVHSERILSLPKTGIAQKEVIEMIRQAAGHIE